ncbi:MAG: alanyl-tRNA editing protein [Acidobacteria bacterium]|nr:MAG: alanyl-tRNA editing protein [Acidobacteriota bacterium]
MGMKKIFAYEKDAYLTELKTEVIETGSEKGKDFVVLRDTVFYPEGGGQPGDRGWINDVTVSSVRQENGAIRHYVDAPVPSGEVLAELDWPRRYDHMQQHTAQHLVTALAQDRFDWPTKAFHLGNEVSDIELGVSQLSAEQLDALEEAVASEIRAARRVHTSRVAPDRLEKLNVRTRGLPAGHEGPVRLVEIDGIDLNTCGGTHVRWTAEIEAVKLLNIESMRGGTRLYFVAGGRVRRRLAEHEARNIDLRSLLGAPEREFAAAVRSRLDQIQELQHRERMMRDELADAASDALAHRPEDLIEAHFKSGDPAFLQSLAHKLQEKSRTKAALLTAGNEGDGFFVVVAGDRVGCDVQALGRQVAILLNGKGGGTGRIFQGRVRTLAKRKDALALFQLELERD